MIENNTCKKCGRILPKDYKYNKCESCRNKTVSGMRKTVKVMGGIALSTVPFILNKIYSGKNK
ncbi:hypothetical protein QM799_01940 [Streptococcus infantis]|jgi:hypothetical protein|uniref:hypothetical protein n=1 Tax=Streptococcus infantis TaxID=68892 RepID=UPI0039C4CA03